MKASVLQLFEDSFGEHPRFLVRSPGRVNMIGEHTDYNDGFVFPMAIDYAVWIAFSPVPDKSVSLIAGDFGESAMFHLDAFHNTQSGWIEYIKSVASVLQNRGHSLSGWKGCILSNLPIGSGLSSSAALEMAAIKAFTEVSGFTLKPAEMAVIGQKAENHWVGINCGIMDQLASACGVRDCALLIDCRSLELEAVPVPEKAVIAVLDTTTRRKLLGTEYNHRRQQCETAAAFFGVTALRDLTLEKLLSRYDHLDEAVGRRALHVVSENDRVLSTVRHLKNGDLEAAGHLIHDSHVSLRDLYEVSSQPLNQIVEAAMESSGCYGARMTGAGFGGCGVALVDKMKAEPFSHELCQRYRSKSGLTAGVFITPATAGTELIPLD
ncbi:MAG: galactokinase [bacterium]